jgi:hypothetical protein
MSEEIIDQQEQKKAPNGTFQLEDNSGRAKIASIFILIITILNIPLLFAEIGFLQALEHGFSEEIEEMEIYVGLISSIQFLINIPCIIFFIRWFKRAYTNLNTRITTDETPGWTIGSWFIPIVGLYKPFQIMKEMWTKTISILNNTYNGQYKNSKILLGFWWLLWIVVSIGGNITYQLNTRSTDLTSLITSAKIDVILSILSFPLGILAYFVIVKYNKLEGKLTDLEFERNLNVNDGFELENDSLL